MSNKFKNKNPPNQTINKVIDYFHNKKFSEAQALAESISKKFPSHPICWKILGLLYLIKGELNKALVANQKAIKIIPNSTEILNNLSITFYKLGKIDDAIISAKKALNINPNFHEAYAILSDILKEREQYDDASLFLKKAIKINPNNIVYYSSLAEVYHKLGNTSKAISMYQKAVNLNPNYYQSYLNLGNLLTESKKFKEAEDIYNKVIKMKPDSDLGYLNLANLQKSLNRNEDAIKNYLKAIQNNPNQAEIYFNLANTFLKIGEINKAKLNYEKAIEINPNNPKFISNKLLILNFFPDLEQNYIYEQHLLFDKQFCKNKYKFISKTKNQDLNKKLRIGYISPDFRRHSVAYFFETLIKNHNDKFVEIYCYYNNTIVDKTTERIKSYCKNWRSIFHKSDESVVQKIQDDEIDILVDLCGHSAGNRLLVFALKPAPLQITYLGYPNTTGLSTIDYRITDKFADPYGNSDLFCSEKLIRVPKCFLCYNGNDDFKIKKSLPLHSNNYVTFGSFNNFNKINAKVIEVWSSILRSIPKSRLILKILTSIQTQNLY